MLASVRIILACAVIGAYIRHEARENHRPWLVTAVLAVLFLALSLLKPPGQEFFAIWWGATGGAATGALFYGIIACIRKSQRG